MSDGCLIGGPLQKYWLFIIIFISAGSCAPNDSNGVHYNKVRDGY
jgi:hypothetical protein